MCDNNGDDWVLFRDRAEWKDVVPIPQDDAEEPVVSIAYSERFTDVYDHLRAIIKTQEKSERALELTKAAATLNPANYTVWQYRRDILKALKKDLKEEMEYIRAVICKNSKNYQVWHHRKILVEWLDDPSQELELTKAVLQDDDKNYHAWQHRQWVIRTYSLYDGELDYIDSLLTDDLRNNTAWNQRFFVINNTTGFTDEVMSREIDYTLEKIRLITENESAWNYLRGVLLHDKESQKHDIVSSFCEELYKNGNRSPFLLALLVDMCDDHISQGSAGDSVYNVDRAKSLCSDLATKYDPVRCKYWDYMASTIEKKAKGQDTSEASASKEGN